jgi:hypothetical protein
MSFGTQFMIINDTASSVSIVLDPASATTVNAGSLGKARLFVINAGTPAALDFALGGVTAGLASTDMSFAIGTPNVGTGVSAPLVVLNPATPGGPVLNVDTWTAAAAGGSTATFGGSFDGSTGLGTLTLDNTGQAHFTFGATMSNDKSTVGPYPSDTYTGTVRISVAY